MHPCPRNWVAIGRAIVFHARGDQAFSAGIKCRHCMCFNTHIMIFFVFLVLFAGSGALTLT